MADAGEQLELEPRVARGGIAGQIHAHESVLLTVHDERGSDGTRRGEMPVGGTAAELAEQRPGCIGVRRSCFRVRVPLRGQVHEPLPQRRVESRPVGEAELEREVDESLRPDEACTRRHRSSSDRGHHQGCQARDPPPVGWAHTAPGERRVDEHERVHELRASCRDTCADDRAHRVADDHRTAGVVEQRLDELAIRREGRPPIGRAGPPEADEVDRGDGRTEAVGEQLPDRHPRDRVGTEAVDEEDAAHLVTGDPVGSPLDGVDAHAVDLQRVRATGFHSHASVFVMLVPEPDATWGLDFARADGIAGFLRLLRFGDRCWCWAYVVGPGLGLVVVRDADVPAPRRTEILDVRAEGLWMELVCETPGEHWTFGLEAFAVRLDEPGDALRGEIGERLPLGFDLEWETDGSGSTGSAHGELLVGDERIELDAAGVLRNATPPLTAWPTAWSGACHFDDGQWVHPAVAKSALADAGLPVPVGWLDDDGHGGPLDPLAIVPIPLGVDARGSGPVLVRVLARMHAESARMGVGWLEVLQSDVAT